MHQLCEQVGSWHKEPCIRVGSKKVPRVMGPTWFFTRTVGLLHRVANSQEEPTLSGVFVSAGPDMTSMAANTTDHRSYLMCHSSPGVGLISLNRYNNNIRHKRYKANMYMKMCM